MIENKTTNYYPILLNLQKFSCLVIGGGKVALRKVVSLQRFNAKVTVLSPKICTPLRDLHNEKKIKIIQKTYSKEYLDNL